MVSGQQQQYYALFLSCGPRRATAYARRETPLRANPGFGENGAKGKAGVIGGNYLCENTETLVSVASCRKKEKDIEHKYE